MSGKYKLPNRSRLRAGYIFEEIERPRQDREETEEDTYWVSWQTPMMGAFNAKVKYSFADRDGTENDADNITVLMDPFSSGSSLHPDGAARYTLSDRKQNKYQFNATYGFSNTASIGTNIQVWDDDYDAVVGLQQLKGQMFTVDLAFQPTRVLSVSTYTGMQRFTFDQRSSAGNVPWTQETEQTSWVTGVDVDWQAIPNKLVVNLGLRYTDSTGDITQVDETPGTVTELPDIETSIATLELGAEYFLDKQTTLLFRAVYEDYSEKNWAYDGFGTIQATNATRSYLTGGLDSPNYQAGLIEFGVRHDF
ncbi:MAG: MtrB/PioB family outer membrane beta-barrel protein [Motiliproteus sp.]